MDSSTENRADISISMDESEEEAAFLFAMKLVVGSTLPMALKSAIELDLLELIKKAGAGASASASELAAQLPTDNPQAADMIDRILRLLAAYSVLNCSLKTLADGGVERRYSLAPVCKFLTRNGDGVSVAPVSLLIQDRVFLETWYHLKDAVLEGGVPFDRAYGVHAFEYPAMDPRFNKVFNQAMYEQSTIFMKRILEIYKGFEVLKSLVDVGGGIGASLRMIVSKYPSIKGINFDLPHVIQHALPHPARKHNFSGFAVGFKAESWKLSAGVEHVGGDMFVSVPKADAIFMKWICHDWSDAHCQKLLKNCYEALPQNGKVIVAESILPEDPNSTEEADTWTIQGDVNMLAYNPGGKERTEKEFQALAKHAGFKHVIRVCYAFTLWIMEFHK